MRAPPLACTALLLLAFGCSDSVVEVGGGLLARDGSLDAAQDTDSDVDSQSPDPRDSDWSSSESVRRTRDNGGPGNGDSSDGADGDSQDESYADGGRERPCDTDGPYCTPDGEIFVDQCMADRAGARDEYYCPWAEL